MNRAFSLVWNAAIGNWVVTHERVRRRRKPGATRRILRMLIVLGAGSVMPALAWAACTPAVPAAGATVTCTGLPITSNSFSSGTNNLTVNIAAGTQMTAGLLGGTAIALSGTNATLNNNGTVDPSVLGLLSTLSTGVSIGNASSTSINVNNLASGALYGTGGLLGANLFNLDGMALALTSANNGTVQINNAGWVDSRALLNLSILSADTPVIAVTGGGAVQAVNTGTINGRVGFQSSAAGNTFINAGTINGSVSLGAGSTNSFTAVVGGSVYSAGGLAPELPGPGGLLSFAATGLVDGGVGGTNTLILQNSASGTGSGTNGIGAISTAQYVNFGGLRVNSGTWTLGGASRFATTALNGGVAVFTDPALLGGAIIANGGTLEAAAANLVLAPAGGITLGAGGLSVQGGNDLTLGGIVRGTGGLVKSGTGALTLNGANSFGGGVNLLAGELRLGHGSALGSGVFNAVGGSLLADTAIEVVTAASITNDVGIGGDSDLRLGGVLSGMGTLVKVGSGTLTMLSSNTYLGGTTLKAGKLVLNAFDSLGSGSLTVDGGQLDARAALSIGNAVVLNNTLGLGESGNALTLTGRLSGSGGLNKTGSGTLALNGNNDFSGGTALASGTLQLGHASALGTGLVRVTGASRLSTSTDLALANDFNLADALDWTGSQALTLDGAIGGGGSLAKSGAGDLTLSRDNAYGGGTVLSSGRLRVSANAALGTGTLTASGGELDATTAVSLGNTIALSGTLAVGSSGEAMSLTGAISGLGGLNKLGSGTLTLSGQNDYTGGTQLDAGTLRIARGDALGTGQLLVTGNASLQRTADLALYNTIALSAGALTLDGAQALTLGGSLSGAGSLIKSGSGVLTLGGTNAYTGGTQVVGGTVRGSAASVQGDIALDQGALLVFDQAINGSYAGALEGGGQVIKAGGGSLTVNGDSGQFNGLTQVDGGRFVVGGTAAQSAARWGGEVEIASGAELGGHGTLAGNVLLRSGATLAPGNSVGTLSVDGNLQLEQGSALDFEFGAPASGDIYGAFGQGDSVAVSGDLRLEGATLNVADAGGFGAGLYRVFSYGGALTLSNGGLSLGAVPQGRYTLQYLGGNKQINLLNLSGGVLQFWNANGQASQTTAGGGTGTWSNASPVWTDEYGSFTSVMTPAAGVGVFAGDAGRVTIDNSSGAVLASGLQFASDGYEVLGDTLTLVQDPDGAQPVIRVGDGSASGASMTTIIHSSLDGSSGLHKTDLGTLVLTGNNGYTGVTRIAGGAIAIASDAALGDASANLWLDGGVLRVTGHDVASLSRGIQLGSQGGGFDVAEATHTLSVGQSLSGSGMLVKLGAGTLELHGVNDYTGGTAVRAGTLRGNTDSLAGAIANDAQLVFDQAVDGTYLGAISGSGKLVKIGQGGLSLQGENSYAGGTVIESGRLQGDTRSLQGDIANEGALVFAQQDAGTYAGTLSGSGTLTKTGAGALRLTGSTRHTGGTQVREGSLIGSTQALQGQIFNEAALVIEQADDGVFTGAISGQGRLVKAGTGAVTLEGRQAYTGGTTILGGVLRGDSESLRGDIANDAALVFAQAGTGTHTGTISGRGSLSLEGTGTLILAGNNTYTGGTTVTSGILQGSTASLQGEILNNGSVVIDQDADGGYAGAMSGTGSLTKRGSGQVLLSGANTYTGGTWIEGGSLQGTAASLRGDIVSNARLILDQVEDGVLAGVLAGTGSLVKTGAGALTVRQAQGFTGSTEVQQGTLVVGDAGFAEAALGGKVTVGTEARIQGVGSIGALDLHGTLAPGNSIGTLHVAGDASLRATSTFLVEADAEGHHDQLAVGGHTEILGGTVLTLAEGTTWSPLTRYAILTSEGGVSGRFDTVRNNLAFLAPTLAYDATSVTLSLARNDASFASAAETANQRSTAAALDSLGEGALYGRIVSLDGASARQAFDAFSGEVRASAQGVAFNDAARVRRTLVERLADAEPLDAGDAARPRGAWASGWGNWGRTEGDGNAAHAKHHGSGWMAGSDATLDNGVVLGLALGQARSSLSVRDRGSDATMDSKHAGLYGATTRHHWTLRGGLTGGRIDNKIQRSTGASGGDQRLHAYDDATLWQGFVEVGHETVFGRAGLAPYLHYARVELEQDAFTEQGGDAALAGAAQTRDVDLGIAGVRFEWRPASRARTALVAHLGYQRAWGDTQSGVTQRFVAGGAAFDILGVPLARDLGFAELGLKSQFTPRMELKVDYQGRFGSGFRDQGAQLSLAGRF